MNLLLHSIVAMAVALPGQTEFVPADELWPVHVHQGGAANHLAVADGATWFLHPDGNLRLRESASVESADDLVSTVRERQIPLPPGAGSTGHLGIFASSSDELWLVDHASWRLWRLGSGRWSGPWQTGELIDAAASDSLGDLIISTPSHPASAFAVIGRNGTVTKRFGDRLRPIRQGIDTDWNQWTLLALPSGRIVAAHRYSELVRVYERTGELVTEWLAEFPGIDGLREAAGKAEDAVRVDPATCCWAARLVTFVSRIVRLSEEHVGLQFGDMPVLERFDHSGTWSASIPVRLPEGTRINHIVAHGDDLAIDTDHGIRKFVRLMGGREFRGSVLSANGHAISGATLTVTGATGVKFGTVSGEDGSYAFHARPTDSYELTVSAAGHRTARLSGVLSRIASPRIVLHPTIRQCVRVTDADSKQPVQEFELEIVHDTIRPGTVDRTSVSTRISAQDGGGCVESPFDPPWKLRVSSSGYLPATRDSGTPPAETYQIALQRGLALEVALSDQRTAGPIGGAVLRLIPQAEERRSSSDRLRTASSDESGTGRFEGLPEGRYQLIISHEHYADAEREIVIIDRDVLEHVDLEKGAALRVNVRSASGEVSGAAVSTELVNQVSARRLECTTNERGECIIYALGPGRYQLYANADGFVTGSQPVDVGRDDVEVDVHLQQSLRLFGRVEYREEYSDLDLEILVSKPGVPFITAPLDQSGRFVIERSPSGTINVRIQERGSTSTLLFQRVDVPIGPSSHELRLALPFPLILSGSIHRERQGCGSCSLTIRRAGGEVDRAAIRASIDSSGRYTARIPGGGLYVARAVAPDGTQQQEIIEIRQNSIQDFDLDQHQLTLTVRYENGALAPGARVFAVDEITGISILEAVTDSRATVRMKVNSTYVRITASSEGFSGSATYNAESGRREIDLVLKSGSRLRLDLRGGGGVVIQGAIIRVRSSRTGADLGPRFVSRNDHQPFELSVPSEEPVDVIIKAPQYAYKTLYGLSPSVDHSITLQGGLTLTVDVAPSIRPCAIHLIDAEGRTYGLSTDFPPGPVPLTTHMAMFNPIEAGSYTAVLHTCSGNTLTKLVHVVPGGTTPLLSFEP
jgi:hypothetical protein